MRARLYISGVVVDIDQLVQQIGIVDVDQCYDNLLKLYDGVSATILAPLDIVILRSVYPVSVR
mgnify:CR=1 FL=1